LIPINIYDTTLRDGEQAPGAALEYEQKLAIAVALEQLGVDTIEAGFPAASANDASAVRAIAEQSRNSRVAAFARTTIQDIELAAISLRAAVHPRITLVFPASDLHLSLKLRLDRSQALEMLVQMISHARNLCAEVEVIAEDATRSDADFLCKIAYTSMKAGAKFFTVADTVGYASPEDIRYYFGRLLRDVPELADIVLGIHCHDDLGLATINSLVGLKSGARQIHCTINGIGERAGNAALEEIVMALNIRPDQYPFKSLVDTTQFWQISRLVSQSTRFPVSPNKAIVGANAFSHGSGMHQDGMLKATSAYEIMTPESVGAPSRNLPITRHSGRKGITHRISELGYALDEAELDIIYTAVKGRIASTSVIDDQELSALVMTLCSRFSRN
jgi:2-isopropylmalate synthase